jgi:hypothetical protein
LQDCRRPLRNGLFPFRIEPSVAKTAPPVKTVERKISVPVKVEKPVTGYDLDKLARAVAHAETGNCTKGAGLSHNNAFGIMTWPNGKRQFKRYATCEESYEDFKRIWSRYYGRFPDHRLAVKYTGNDRADTWLANVKAIYSSL